MDATDVSEWLKVIARWVHVFAAILWIGQTWLFHFFEKNLVSDAKTPANIVGNLWLVHGGGFYLVEKQRQPEIMPRTLHWFKWESLTTWVSGVLLITLTYYTGGLLVEPEMDYNVALGVGVGLVIVGWAVYDLLVVSPLGKHDLAIAGIGLALLMALAWGLRHVMSSRAAYMHVGFLVGTIMTANVWMRILPSQRKMLAAAKEGKPADPKISARGPQRSKHNSFMVVPLVFIMISNHYPTISYGHEYSWLVLGIVVVVGWIAARVVRNWGAPAEQGAARP